mmetsp:Transcript_43399/g.112692  ORF Transcript_43399/g.112692 Transcript_43399/m.112692 type:complete len:90 (+) Transcript_43399:134-403(+)
MPKKYSPEELVQRRDRARQLGYLWPLPKTGPEASSFDVDSASAKNHSGATSFDEDSAIAKSGPEASSFDVDSAIAKNRSGATSFALPRP